MRNHLISPSLILTFFLLWLLSGCSSTPLNEDASGRELYEQGHTALQKEYYLEAIEAFDDLQIKYPFGDYAQQGELEKAYAHFKSKEYSSTDEILQRFMRIYPRHPHIEYAYYLRALASYERGTGVRGKLFKAAKFSRTNVHAKQAFQHFSLLIKRFPHSHYREDSIHRMRILRNHLAQHELHIAGFYMQRKAYVAAANRATEVLETYPQSAYIPQALAVLIEAYRALGMNDLADDSQRVLTLNHFAP